MSSKITASEVSCFILPWIMLMTFLQSDWNSTTFHSASRAIGIPNLIASASSRSGLPWFPIWSASHSGAPLHALFWFRDEIYPHSRVVTCSAIERARSFSLSQTIGLLHILSQPCSAPGMQLKLPILWLLHFEILLWIVNFVFLRVHHLPRVHHLQICRQLKYYKHTSPPSTTEAPPLLNNSIKKYSTGSTQMRRLFFNINKHLFEGVTGARLKAR